MEQSKFLRAIKLFPGSDIVRKCSFKTVGTRGKSAHFAKKIAKNDRFGCFGCLSPTKNVA